MAEYIEREGLTRLLETAIELQKSMAVIVGYEEDPEIQMEIKAYTDILNGVKELPAADVKPVVHGSWLVSSTELHYDDTCSACGESFYSPIRGAYIIHHANFCPNCGADMRGET